MELKRMTKDLLDLLSIDDIQELPDRLLQAVQTGDTELMDRYCGFYGHLDRDFLQPVWQFFLSDRKGLKQDFTPPCLANLLARLDHQLGDVVLDLCAGSGALTIQAWEQDSTQKFVCIELDPDLIKLLLFNLAVRNIEADVLHMDALTGEVFQTYSLISGERYSSLQEQPRAERLTPDRCISNPPYNLRHDGKLANYQFVELAMERVKRSAHFILPTGILKNDAEKEGRKKTLPSLYGLVLNPYSMFESTSVSTVIMSFSKTNDDWVRVVNGLMLSTKVVREQRGEEHSKNRIYKKKLNIYNEDTVNMIADFLNRTTNGIGKSGVSVLRGDLKDKLGHVRVYFPSDKDTKQPRELQAIADDILRINRYINRVKISCNSSWARELGLEEVIDLLQAERELTDKMNKTFRFLGIEGQLMQDNYFSTTASKKLIIENVDKEYLSEYIVDFIRSFSTHIRFLNAIENEYLAEFRDALLPKLISGEIDVSKWDLH